MPLLCDAEFGFRVSGKVGTSSIRSGAYYIVLYVTSFDSLIYFLNHCIVTYVIST